MKEQLISLETACLAHETGYKIPCWSYLDTYNDESSVMDYIGDTFEEKLDHAKEFVKYWRPTQSVLQKWLRELHNIDVDVSRDTEIHYKDEIRWIVHVSNWNYIKIIKTSIAHLNSPADWYGIDFKSYEEAFERGLYNALKLVKYEDE